MLRHVSPPIRQQQVLSRLCDALTPTTTRQASTTTHKPVRPFVDALGKPRRFNARTQPTGKYLDAPKQRLRYVQSTEDQTKHKGSRFEATTLGPLLRAPILAQRLTKLCDEGKYDDAVAMIRNAPRDAQNVIVWNTLILGVTKAWKFQTGYHLFIDMKRRGLQPTSRTYATMLKGYANISKWSEYSKQLDNVHALYSSYQQYVEIVRERDPRSAELNTTVANLYIKILGKAGLWQKMFDVFNDMDEAGPTAADVVTYTHLFRALWERWDLPTDGDTIAQTNVAHQNASDAKFLWKRFLKLVEQGRAEVDPPILTNLLRLLSLGRPSDHLAAFDIVRDYVGFCKPGETSPKPQVELTPQLLGAVLELCQMSSKPRLTIHFAQQIMDRPVLAGQLPILDSGHMQQVLSSYAQLASLGSMNESRQALDVLEWMLRMRVTYPEHQKMLPTLTTYKAAFTCFWRGKDWVSATKAFELMTGYSGQDFRDNASGHPRAKRYSDRKGLSPNAYILSAMCRTAHESGDRANMRQCLRILDKCEATKILQGVLKETKQESEGTEGTNSTLSVKRSTVRHQNIQKRIEFYEKKLAEAMIELIDTTLKKAPLRQSTIRSEDEDGEGSAQGLAGYIVTPGERQAWLALREQAETVVKKQGSLSYLPSWDSKPLGSEQGLSATEVVVEKALARRNSSHSI